MYTLVAEQDDFLVIHKRAGVSLHNETGDGLIQAIRRERNSQQIFPVHRLDKATSGLLLLATNRQANQTLSQLFQHRQVEKYYLAVSQHKPTKKQGLVSGDMVRTRNGNWKLTRDHTHPAVTQFFSYGLGDGQRLFVLKPTTGKTHQLRVALKSLGSPIIGDHRYGQAGESHSTLLLHAWCLRFIYNGHDYAYQQLPNVDSFGGAVITLVQRQLPKPWTLPWPILPTSLRPEHG